MPSHAHGLKQTRYKEWLYAQDVRFDFHDEIATMANHSKDGVLNDTPPVELWHAIVPTVRLVELIREQFGPTTLNSAYRTPQYNLAVAKSTDSQHSHNTALDFKCKTGSPVQWRSFLRELRTQKVFTGGIGIYPTFVHVDTRGTVADWDER